jgi:hypothetical protein
MLNHCGFVAKTYRHHPDGELGSDRDAGALPHLARMLEPLLVCSQEKELPIEPVDALQFVCDP